MIDVKVPISLEVGCGFGGEDAVDLLEQLADGRYELMSVLPCPLTIDRWLNEHRTARKRSYRAFGRGYRAGILKREDFPGDIYQINTSAEVRQGRGMSQAYREIQSFAPLPDYPCPRHATRTTGVWKDGTLVAYLVMIRAGELSLVSQILGHADHLENEVMYLLFQQALEREIDADPECLVVYGRYDSGTDGLRFFKERLGFEERPVEWCP